MEARIQKAIDIFLDAINNNTLAKGTCVACAVGNLVSHELNIKPEIKATLNENYEPHLNSQWGTIVLGLTRGNKEEGLKQCNLTDFTISELTEIERAFENNTQIPWHNYGSFSKEKIRVDQIKGLEAVVKTMLNFSNSQENVKKIFTNKAELIAIN
jgi:hypothetical protein